MRSMRQINSAKNKYERALKKILELRPGNSFEAKQIAAEALKNTAKIIDWS